MKPYPSTFGPIILKMSHLITSRQRTAKFAEYERKIIDSERVGYLRKCSSRCFADFKGATFQSLANPNEQAKKQTKREGCQLYNNVTSVGIFIGC